MSNILRPSSAARTPQASACASTVFPILVGRDDRQSLLEADREFRRISSPPALGLIGADEFALSVHAKSASPYQLPNPGPLHTWSFSYFVPFRLSPSTPTHRQ